MRVLVTGGAGFIGSHLCRRLIAEGHEVVALDDLSEGSQDNLTDAPEARFERVDICDRESVAAAARDCDVIFHQAARKSVQRSVEDPDAFHRVNVRGTLNVLEAAREVGAFVVFASSSSVFGDQDRFPLTESMELQPRSPYAATKLAGEAYCRAWSQTMGVPTISLRYFNAYGPRQDPSSPYAAVVPRFVTACLSGSNPIIYGDGEQARDFTYIDDVVEANVRAASMPEEARGSVLNTGGGRRPTSVNQLLRTVAGIVGVDPRPIHEPTREGDIRWSEADITLARRLIGYEPKVDIEEGIRRTVAWFRARATVTSPTPPRPRSASPEAPPTST
jgi:nucleoside-diphosphate-sugar epimerase